MGKFSETFFLKREKMASSSEESDCMTTDVEESPAMETPIISAGHHNLNAAPKRKRLDYGQLVCEAISSLQELRGSSAEDIKKFIASKYDLNRGSGKSISAALARLPQAKTISKSKKLFKLNMAEEGAAAPAAAPAAAAPAASGPAKKKKKPKKKKGKKSKKGKKKKAKKSKKGKKKKGKKSKKGKKKKGKKSKKGKKEKAKKAKRGKKKARKAKKGKKRPARKSKKGKKRPARKSSVKRRR